MISPSCDFVAGWIAGMAGLVVGHPIDTLKVRQQILGRPMLESIQNIYKAGGNLTFFRGLGAPLLSTGAMNSIYFGFYGSTLDFMTEWRIQNRKTPHFSGNGEDVLTKRHVNVDSYWDYFIAGCVGGAAQVTVACPIDLVKVQLQSQIHKSQIKGPMDCVQRIIKTNGILGLYKGIGVQSCRDIPSFGLYIVIYEYLKTKLNFSTQQDSTKVSQFLAGGFAGILSWWSIIPLDVIKSRIQGEPDHQERKYRGIIHCGREVLKAHGIRGFFHGFWPLSLRAFPVNGTTFLVYEWLFHSCKQHQSDLYS